MLDERRLYSKLVEDWTTLPEFLEFFGNEAQYSKKNELILVGRIETLSKDLPLIMDKRFTQLQFLNAALDFFEKQLEKTKSKYYKKYLEHYQRALTSRDVDKYVAGEDEVANISLIINEISLIRNIFISLTKSIDAKSWQIRNISSLRTAGLDDATID